ncbi:MAG: hypothetical protein WBL84_23070 [Xanthobacteraceae bacterium]
MGRNLLDVIAGVVWLGFALSHATAQGQSLGGGLELKDFGSFYIHGHVIETQYPNTPATGLSAPGQITVGQMYVQYMIPQRTATLPMVLVHGANHTGKTFETTPDGREGWATYFARHGSPVYVVDHAGRGRSGFDATKINRAKATNDASALPAVLQYPRAGAWVNFRFGPEFAKPFSDLQFPLEAIDQYSAQIVPNTESFLDGDTRNTVEALAELLDRIGPAVVLVHSQSGAFGLDLVRNGAKVAGLIDVEGNCAPITNAELDTAFKNVPFLSVWGDHSEGAVGFNGDTRRNGCVATVNALKERSADASLLLLPAHGIAGNSHMMMLDKNNLKIADLLIEWIAQRAAQK